VVPEQVRVEVEGGGGVSREHRGRRPWRAIVFYKPRGVITSRHDPQGRRTVYDVLGAQGRGLVAVGRLDRATSGLLLLTNDTQLANRIADPVNAVTRVYVATVRGRMAQDAVRRLTAGITVGNDQLRAHRAMLRKASGRESHLTLELTEGKNREVRRLLAAAGHEVTTLKRVALGTLTLGNLRPGEWRPVARQEILRALFGEGPAR
jgi:pseudouridine synthase